MSTRKYQGNAKRLAFVISLGWLYTFGCSSPEFGRARGKGLTVVEGVIDGDGEAIAGLTHDDRKDCAA